MPTLSCFDVTLSVALVGAALTVILHSAVTPLLKRQVIVALPCLFAVILPVFFTTEATSGLLEVYHLKYAAVSSEVEPVRLKFSPTPNVSVVLFSVMLCAIFFTVTLHTATSPFSEVQAIKTVPQDFAVIVPLLSTSAIESLPDTNSNG